MKKRRFDSVMEFTEAGGGILSYVGPVQTYPTPQDFIKGIENEYDYTGDPADVTERYVRFFVHPPEELRWDWPDGCYAFCSPGRGAFKVYELDADKAHELEEPENDPN